MYSHTLTCRSRLFPTPHHDAYRHVSIHHDNGNPSPGPPTKLRNQCLGFIHVAFLFRARTIGRRQTENSCYFENAFGRKSSTFWKWHCLRKIALESKRLIRTWWTWCQITFNRIFYPIQQKSMVFNQEFRWNNGSKSLHSFWATLYKFSFFSRVVFGVAFAGISLGRSMALLPDYAKARHSADLLLHLFTTRPLIDNYSQQGAKPVSTLFHNQSYNNQWFNNLFGVEGEGEQTNQNSLPTKRRNMKKKKLYLI